MSPEQVAAFNSASGTTVSELQLFILTGLFVATVLWAALLLIGKWKAETKSDAFNTKSIIVTAVRVLVVVVLILILVNV